METLVCLWAVAEKVKVHQGSGRVPLWDAVRRSARVPCLWFLSLTARKP